jgi:hypothetical protein
VKKIKNSWACKKKSKKKNLSGEAQKDEGKNGTKLEV